MCVKRGSSYQGENLARGCLTIGCWRRYSLLRRIKKTT